MMALTLADGLQQSVGTGSLPHIRQPKLMGEKAVLYASVCIGGSHNRL